MNPIPKRCKRMYYSAGLISLLLFPLLCLYFMGKNGLYTDLRLVEINWFSEKNWRHIDSPHLFPFDFKSSRKYVDVMLTADEASNTTKLDVAQRQVRALIISRDTVQGIHFHFDGKTSYETFVKVLDICRQERAKFYIPEGNDLWVFNPVFKPNPDYEHHLPSCGNTSLVCLPPIVKTDEELRSEKLQLLKKSLRTYSLSAILFLAMVTLSMSAKRK